MKHNTITVRMLCSEKSLSQDDFIRNGIKYFCRFNFEAKKNIVSIIVEQNFCSAENCHSGKFDAIGIYSSEG